MREFDNAGAPGATKYSKPWSSYQTQYQTLKPKGINSLYLYNFNTGDEITIKLIPDTMAESYRPNIISESPFGILHPINFYSGGSPKKLSFSFDINEDMILEMNISDNIYNAVELIKNMSKPITTNGVYKEPSVYFQLGEQFAGKGHIVTSFSYKKPYNNGRYTLLNISVEFTFHEVFENDKINKLFNNQKEILSGLALGMSDIAKLGDYSDIADFYRQNLDYDYYINNYIFSSSRVKEGFWKEMSEFIAEGFNATSPFSIEEIKDQLLSGNIYDSIFSYAQFPTLSYEAELYNILLELLVYYAQFFEVISKAKFQTHNSTRINIISIRNKTIKLRRSTRANYSEVDYIADKLQLLFEMMAFLIDITTQQIKVYAMLGKAASE